MVTLFFPNQKPPHLERGGGGVIFKREAGRGGYQKIFMNCLVSNMKESISKKKIHPKTINTQGNFHIFLAISMGAEKKLGNDLFFALPMLHTS